MQADKSTKNRLPFWLIFVPLILLEIWALLVFLFHDNWRKGFLFIVSTLFGFLLKYGEIGFYRSYNAMVRNFDFYPMRLVFVVFFFGAIFCDAIHGFNLCPVFLDSCVDFKYSPTISPIGTSLAIGSFIFGMGMQAALCCASGTFVRLGAGNIKSIAVFFFFIVGSTFGIINPIWNSYNNQPQYPKKEDIKSGKKKPIELHWAANLAIILAMYLITLGIDFIRQARGAKIDGADFLFFANLIGKSKLPENKEKKSLWFFQVGMAVLLGLTCCLYYFGTGGMIGISGLFHTFGAGFLSLFDKKVKNWDFFVKGGNKFFKHPIQMDVVDNDIFIFLGAFLASVIQGDYGKAQENTLYDYILGSCGGFLMGVGARMAYGCNIGSLLSGVTGNSLHAYIWWACAALGSYVTLLITRFIGMFRKDPNAPLIQIGDKQEDLLAEPQE